MNRMLLLLKTQLVGLAAMVLAAPYQAIAQSDQSVEVTFRVLCFEHRDDITAVYAGGDASGPKVDVPLYTNEFSDSIRAHFAGGKAAFFIDQKLPDGRPGRKLVAEGALVKSPRQAFMLFPTDAKTGPVYRIVAFDDNENSFPMGSTRAINLTPFPVRFNLAGAEMEVIKPGGISVYPMVKKVDEWNMYTAMIELQPNKDQWIGITTQSWKASDRKRDWVIIRMDPTSKDPVVRLYQDIPPWRETKLQIGTPGKS